MRKTATEQPLPRANTATYTEEYNNITSPSYQTSPEANSIAKPEEEFSKTNLNNASIENVDEDLDKLDTVEETDATTLEAEKEPAYLSENVEDAAEVQGDETLRTDAEILGKHYPIRQLTEKAGNARMGAIEYTKANWENAKDTPGLIARHLAFKLAESSYNRRKNKVDQVAHLSDNHPLKRFRMKKLAKAEARLNRRKASFENRRNQMFGRLNEVKSNMESRRDATVAELADRRRAALTRRATRHVLSKEGAGWRERHQVAKEHVDSMPKEQRDRIANALLNAVEADKYSREASQQTRSAASASIEANNQVEAISGQLEHTRTELNSTRQQAGEITDMEADLVSVKENATKLQEKADSLSDDNANKFAAMNEAANAQREQEEMEKTIADHHKRLAELQQQEEQLTQSLIQSQKDIEKTRKALEVSKQNEAIAKKKAEEAQRAQSQRVNETFV